MNFSVQRLFVIKIIKLIQIELTIEMEETFLQNLENPHTNPKNQIIIWTACS